MGIHISLLVEISYREQTKYRCVRFIVSWSYETKDGVMKAFIEAIHVIFQFWIFHTCYTGTTGIEAIRNNTSNKSRENILETPHNNLIPFGVE